jgi:hypothetical protein
MANHLTISTESDLASRTLPATAVTRRSLLGGAGVAVGAAACVSAVHARNRPGSGAACEPGPATSRRGVQARRLRNPRGLREQ